MNGHLFLIGFMAAGKSTVGQLCGEALDRPFVDLDQRIEETAGKSVRQIFETSGEAGFRQLERGHLTAVIEEPAAVIACGGGAYVDRKNQRAMHAAGTVFWLRVSFETARRRCRENASRPLAGDPLLLKRLFEQREPIYAQADYIIDTDQLAPGKICRQIVEMFNSGQ